VDLSTIVHRAVELVRPKAAANRIGIVIEHLDAGPFRVRCDPLQLREVFTNLLLNAIDAAPMGGRIQVRLGRREQDLYVAVADTGPGVSRLKRERLFEPHFTTKPTGTGMGLFMSYGIVLEHQGKLLYEGGVHGAVFVVLLP